ncbi:hypothetical protein SFUMM280S_07839 [Streptomyces fumanus]
MSRPSSQISAVDSASEIQERTTSSSRAGGSVTSRCARIWTYAACRTESMSALVVEEPTAGPPRISAGGGGGRRGMVGMGVAGGCQVTTDQTHQVRVVIAKSKTAVAYPGRSSGVNSISSYTRARLRSRTVVNSASLLPK